MQAIKSKTQATVELLIVQIFALVAIISRETKPANEEESHTLTTTSNNKRNSVDSPPSSIKTVTAFWIQDIHPFFNSIQLDRHHLSRCCTPFFVWRILHRSLLSNIIFTIQPPVDMTTATAQSAHTFRPTEHPK
jgi:hypothetical protein